MDASDRLVLVAGTPPETLVALLLLVVGLAGIVLAALMAWWGRRGALQLFVVFTLATLAALYALGHLPTRLAFDRNGVVLAFGRLAEHWAWPEIGSVQVRRWGPGMTVAFNDRRAARPAGALFWLGERIRLYVGPNGAEPRLIEMRIEALRMASER